MQIPGGAGGGITGAASGTGGKSAPQGEGTAHSAFVTILGEFVGVALLAILADSSDSAGKVAVALIAGWFLVFLIINAPTISQLLGKLSL